jgi:hypothetical protein
MAAESIAAPPRQRWRGSIADRETLPPVGAALGLVEHRDRVVGHGDLARHAWVALTLLPTPLTSAFAARNGHTRSVRMNARLQTDSATALRALLLNGAGGRSALSGHHLYRLG